MKKLSTLLLTLIAATPAFAGPDFITPSPRARELAASPGNRPIAPSDDVVFAHDSAILHDTEHRQILSTARWLRANPGFTILLEGYADSSGSAPYNQDLATRRAAAVRAQLLARGVPAERIVVVVYGETRATGRLNPLDRRVVMHTTREAIPTVVARALGQGAVNAVWVERGALFTETRAGTSRAVATR